MTIRPARCFLYLSVSLIALGLALPAVAQSHGGGHAGGHSGGFGGHASGGRTDSSRGGRGGGGWQRGGPGWWGVGLGLARKFHADREKGVGEIVQPRVNAGA